MQATSKPCASSYVGENHTSAAHHGVQLRVIRALHARDPRLAVGMEMFDRSYQAVLDDWSAGALDEDDFLHRTHWYANWRFDFGLYRDVLQYAKANHIRLVALNLPFSIPPKIRVGGIEYLSPCEKGFLPAEVDTTIAAHREYSQKIFGMHDFKTRVRFEDFYLAQCVWEDVMAESVAKAGADRMVVLAGNGHISSIRHPRARLHATAFPTAQLAGRRRSGSVDCDISCGPWLKFLIITICCTISDFHQYIVKY
jgi:uncharacterized iron-regulated protein